jgi:hypothetical protein
MKSITKYSITLFSLLLIGLFASGVTQTVNAQPTVTFTNGYIDQMGPDPPCPGGICHTPFNIACGQFLQFAAPGDLNIDVIAGGGAVSLILVSNPDPM